MSRGISYRKEELSIISEAVQTFPDAKIEELVELIHQRIADELMLKTDSKAREKDLKEKLRNLRDIRQAVEKYQKVFN